MGVNNPSGRHLILQGCPHSWFSRPLSGVILDSRIRIPRLEHASCAQRRRAALRQRPAQPLASYRVARTGSTTTGIQLIWVFINPVIAPCRNRPDRQLFSVLVTFASAFRLRIRNIAVCNMTRLAR